MPPLGPQLPPPPDPDGSPPEASPSSVQTNADFPLKDKDLSPEDTLPDSGFVAGADSDSGPLTRGPSPTPVPVLEDEIGPGDVLEMRIQDYGGTSEGLSSKTPLLRAQPVEWTQEDDAYDEESLSQSPEPSQYGSSSGGGASSLDEFRGYTPEEEARVVRKLDRRLVLFLSLLYLLSFLDRSNIGNARIAGMEEDLQTTPPNEAWYEWTLTTFYLTYIAFEWMTLLWRLVRAHILVASVVMTWGVAACLQAVAPSYPFLIGARVLLGIGEAGFTGVPVFMSFFFKREELAFRTAMFISAAPLASTFASTLAWLIVKLGEASPISAWRLLFLVEGFPTVLAAIAAYHIIPDSPQTAPFLTRRERRVATLRLRAQQPFSSSSSSRGDKSQPPTTKTPTNTTTKTAEPTTGFRTRDAFSALADPIAWLTALMMFFSNVAYSSLPVFLPKILHEMGYSTLSAQGLSAPPYLLAFVTVLVTASLSDRLRTRSIPISLHALLSATGYVVLALAEPLHLPPAIRYAAVYPAATGFFSVVTLTVTWNVNNQANSPGRQGGSFALMQIVGQCGPLVGTRLYPDRHAPFYAPGMWMCAAAMVCVCGLAAAMRVYLRKRNEEMERECEEGEDESFVGAGDKGLEKFRYML